MRRESTEGEGELVVGKKEQSRSEGVGSLLLAE